MKRLIEEFDDYIGRVVELKDKEIERKLRFAKDETIETLKINYNRQLSQLIGKLKGLEQAIIRKFYDIKIKFCTNLVRRSDV